MKKVFLFTCLIFVILLLPACNKVEEKAPPSCDKLGGHEFQYVTNDLAHWQECTREGCNYRTKASGHAGGTATCLEKAACITCGATYGTTSAHAGGTATCMELAECSVCGEAYGQLSQHNVTYLFDESSHTAQCSTPGCTYVGQTEAHRGGTATCVSPALCSDCGTPYGELGDHSMGYVKDELTHTYQCLRENCTLEKQTEAHSGHGATCTADAVCDECNYIYATATGHSYVLIENTCAKYEECTVCADRIMKESNHVLGADGITCSVCNKNYFVETLIFQLSEDGKSYVVYDGQSCKAATVIIPAEYNGRPVTEIGIVAFCMNKYVETVILPNTIKIINEGAFDSSSIKSIVIPDSVEVIGNGAFSCSDLESIVFGIGICEIDIDAFGATKLKSVTFPGTVTILSEGIFSHCELLEQVIIEDGVKVIEKFTFLDCPNLKTLILPNTLESVDYEALKDSPSLEYNIHQGLKYLGSVTNPYLALAGSAGATNAVIHPDTKICIQRALLDCEEITSLEIGASVSIIEEWALSGMDALESITVAPENPYYYAVNNLLVDNRINEFVLGCKTSVIPDDGSFSEITLRIFDWNAAIKTIYIPKGIEILHIDFISLYGLEEIIIESGVGKIIVHGDDDGCKVYGQEEQPCFSVYHCHTEEEWQQVVVEYTFDRNTGFRPTDCYSDDATHYFYSETEPTTEGNYWHYVDGVPTPW